MRFVSFAANLPMSHRDVIKISSVIYGYFIYAEFDSAVKPASAFFE